MEDDEEPYDPYNDDGVLDDDFDDDFIYEGPYAGEGGIDF